MINSKLKNANKFIKFLKTDMKAAGNTADDKSDLDHKLNKYNELKARHEALETSSFFIFKLFWLFLGSFGLFLSFLAVLDILQFFVYLVTNFFQFASVFIYLFQKTTTFNFFRKSFRFLAVFFQNFNRFQSSRR